MSALTTFLGSLTLSIATYRLVGYLLVIAVFPSSIESFCLGLTSLFLLTLLFIQNSPVTSTSPYIQSFYYFPLTIPILLLH